MNLDTVKKPKILMLRRDNIGDLVCTLPLIAALRQILPGARIDLLVNSYCAPVVEGNPDINRLFCYTKAKHRKEDQNWFSIYAKRFLLTLRLRLTRYDYLILANVSCLPRPLRWAKQIDAKRVVGFIEPEKRLGGSIVSDPIPLYREGARHEVEHLMALLAPFGKVDSVPKAVVKPNPTAKQKALAALESTSVEKPIIGINISARLRTQRWPAEKFIEIIRRLAPRFRCVLFWSPGAETSAGHPGDDVKASEILAATRGLDVLGYSTLTLADLIAGIDCVDLFVSPDGGALHIGAACGKPIIALFGEANPEQWYPWGVKHLILRPATRNLADLSVDELEYACLSMLGQDK